MRPAPMEARRFPNKKKSTHHWCGGKVGREHIPQTVVDVRRIWPRSPKECHFFEWNRGDREWQCYHVITCEACGKILDHYPPCPDKPEGARQFLLSS